MGCLQAYKLASEGKATFSSLALADTVSASVVADPNSIAGQTPGAILTIKQQGDSTMLQVGDLVRFFGVSQENEDHNVVKHLKSAREAIIKYKLILPFDVREVCSCERKGLVAYHRVYVDYPEAVKCKGSSIIFCCQTKHWWKKKEEFYRSLTSRQFSLQSLNQPNDSPIFIYRHSRTLN